MTDVERKLAAILSADVVGYSRLMAEDEAATIRTLNAYREEIALLVAQHRGRVVDTPGDNVLAEFPTALDAVRCAVEIQGVLRARNASLPAERRMDFRIGVHMGDVAVEEGRVYGDGVNIAARLEALAEAGGICISATVREQVRNKLDVGYVDLGDQTIKNIPEQVHVYRIQPRSEPEGLARGSVSRGKRRSRLRAALVAAAAVLLLLGVGLWASWPRPLGLLIDLAGVSGPPVDPPLPDKPSIVVLPFANMSGDPEQEYFSDGITEDLTTELARNPYLFVISRNSAFTYKGKSVKVEDVGRELGVRYVLEGSVRKAEGPRPDHGAADRRDHGGPPLERALRPGSLRHLRAPVGDRRGDPGGGGCRDRSRRSRAPRAEAEREPDGRRSRLEGQLPPQPRDAGGQREGAASLRACRRARPGLRRCPCRSREHLLERVRQRLELRSEAARSGGGAGTPRDRAG